MILAYTNQIHTLDSIVEIFYMLQNESYSKQERKYWDERGNTDYVSLSEFDQKRINEGLDDRYVFMDTGAEHPKTYEFIRNVVKCFNIDLICLKPVTHFKIGVGNTYEIIPLTDIGKDLQSWKDMLKKYGTPYNPGGAFCTDRMKTTPYLKYCNDIFGKGGYVSWLGIRQDEPKRLKSRQGFDYLASISDFDKEDVLSWWQNQLFDLEITEHLGNCVFCIKKGVNKVALAAKDEPELADKFMQILESKNVREVECRKSPTLEMYRGRMSLRQVIASYEDIDRDELFNSLRSSKRFDSGSCSESCEVFNDDYQLDMFKEEV